MSAFAVDAHARGDDELAHRPFGERVQQHRRAEGVRGRVLGLLVHALTDADPGREVDDGIDALERAADDILAAHVAGEQLDVGAQVLRAVALVHLVDQHVERAHRVAGGEQLVREVGADEAGAAGDQDAFHGRNVMRAGPSWTHRP